MTQSQNNLIVEGRPGGPLGTVTYVLTDTATGQWAIVDPTYDVLETWSDRLPSNPPPQAVYVTHPHFDHMGGLADVRRLYPEIPVWVHPDGREMTGDGSRNGAQWAGFPYEGVMADHFYKDGDTIHLGQTDIKILDAPGHCPGSVLLLADRQLLVGDVLFQGSVGRWDLPGASYDVLAASIREKVMTLPDETIVYPGHGDPTTVGEERQFNEIVRKMLKGERYD